jgi:hypothetical protein
MKYLSALLTDARASIGGATASKNRSGNYFRARIAPVQPRTPNQQFIRASLSTLSASWRALTQEQIAAWNALAATIVRKDSLGNSYNPTGEGLYVGNNVALTHLGQAIVTDPPASAPTFPGPLGLSATATAGTPSFDVLSGLAAAPTGYLLNIRATKQLSAGISFVGKGLFRNVFAAPATDFATVSILSDYTAQFGALVAGSVIGVEMRLIELASGFQNLAQTEVILVGA